MVDDVFWVAVAPADAEPLGDAERLGDRDGVVFGLAALEVVVVGACAGVEQPPDGTVVTVCSGAALCGGLGFAVVVGFGVGVVLEVALPLALGLELPLGLALPLALALVVSLDVLAAGLLDRAAALVLVTVFDGLGEAAGDDEQVAGTVALCSADPVTCVALPYGWPPPVLAEGDACPCELTPIV